MLRWSSCRDYSSCRIFCWNTWCRPEGTTIDARSGIGMSGGYPVGTTAAAGYNVGMSNGRPVGTNLEKGYDVGRCTNLAIDFSGYDLPTDWDVSSTLNIGDDLHTELSQ